MKKITILLLLSFLIVSTGLAQTFGGNLPALRPAYTTDDETQFDLALSYIKPGNVARVATIFWEVNWLAYLIYSTSRKHHIQLSPVVGRKNRLYHMTIITMQKSIRARISSCVSISAYYIFG